MTRPEHEPYRELLLAPCPAFFAELRRLGADVPALQPALGEPWQRLLRTAERAHTRSFVRVYRHAPRNALGGLSGPVRGLPPGVANPVRPRQLPRFRVGDRISYVLGLDDFEAGPGNAVHLWGLHAGTFNGKALHVPLLPAPWATDAFEGPAARAWNLSLDVPEAPGPQRCLVVQDGWGDTVEVLILVSRRPMEADVLDACRRCERIDQETLDLAAARLLDTTRWPPGSWTLLRTSYTVQPADERQPSVAELF